MGVLESLLRSRRTRRFPWDVPVVPGVDTDHWGSGAVDESELMPRRPMEVRTGELDSVVAAPVESPPPLPEAPGRQIFSEGTSAPVLQPPPALRRTISLTPEVEPMPSEPLAPLPPEALRAQRRLTRPQLQNTGDQSADLQRYEQSLSEWKDPADRNGRLKSFGLGALRGLMRGLATGGGLGAGIGGALAGGIHGGVAPNADEREWRDAEVARTQQQQATLQGRRLGALKLRGMEADVAKTEAERDALLNPKPKEPKLFQGADGLQYEYDPQTKEARPIPGQGRKAGQAKVLRTTVRGGKVWYETEEGLKPATDPTTGEQLAEPMREITLGGQKFNVSESEAARILGGVEAANITSGNQFGNQSYEDTVRQQERSHAQAVSQWEAAGREQAQLVKAVAEVNEAITMRDLAAKAGKEDERAQWDALAGQRKATVEKLAATLQSAYGDFVENDAQGWPTKLRPRPAAPAPPQRPAPQRRSAGAAPRQSGTVRNATPSSVMSVIERIRSRR